MRTILRALLCTLPLWVPSASLNAQSSGNADGVVSESEAQAAKDPLAAAKAQVHSTFPNLEFDDVRESEIPGIVEIYAGSRILYYAPAQNILVLGELYGASGVSLTEQKISQLAAAKAKDLDKSQALVVGEGGTELVAFVDPDCHFCRQAYQWFSEQKFPGVKQYVYFMSTQGRPQAHARAARALCAGADHRADALRSAFERDPTAATPAGPPCEGVESRLAAHAQYAAQLGVFATPFFIVQGQVVAGFDRERLTELLTRPHHSGG